MEFQEVIEKIRGHFINMSGYRATLFFHLLLRTKEIIYLGNNRWHKNGQDLCLDDIIIKIINRLASVHASETIRAYFIVCGGLLYFDKNFGLFYLQKA